MSRVLVLNAGSSSLKASVVDSDTQEQAAEVQVAWGSDATRAANRRATVERALSELWQTVDVATLVGAGHRVVHGGERFRHPALVDDAMLGELEDLSSLAPLHNEIALDTIRAQRSLLPDLAAVACFDTTFHATLPEEAFVYPLPWHWYEEWRIRRFGFHGLSVAWSVRRTRELLERPAEDLDLIVAHLGSGCSITAVHGGRSVSTSMGMTPLEGVMMGTRSGSVDPGILINVVRDGRQTIDELADALDHSSGLLGVSGVSGDVREVTAAADAGSRRARLAIDLFVRRAAAGIAVAAVALPRADALVFTGGIGEHAADIRAAICARLANLGVEPLEQVEAARDTVLSRPGARVAVLRVEAREDIVIAEAVAALLG